jgi:multidrug resistance efflux pump
MRRRLPFVRTLLFLIALFLLSSAAVLGLLRLDRVVVAPGSLTGGSAAVCSPRDGIVFEVTARGGAPVRAGDVLLKLDTRELEAEAAGHLARLEGLRGEREARLAELERFEEAVHPRERDQARGTVERARVEQRRTDLEADATTRLGEQGIVGRIQVEKADLDRKLAAMTLERAQEDIGLLDAQQRAAVESLSAEIRRLDGEMEAERLAREASLGSVRTSTVSAPVGGTVVASRLEDLPGRAVKKGDEILRLQLGSPGKFEGTLTDAGRASAKPGQKVKIRLDAYPWLIHGTLKGRVTRAAELRGDTGGFPVEIEIEPATVPGPLREGMAGTARIVVEEKVSLGRLFLEKLAGRGGS